MNRLPIRIALIAVLLPFAFAVVGVAIQLAWLPDLPTRVTTHWGVNGADRTAPAWTVPLILGIIGVVTPGVFGLILARTMRPEGPSWVQKLLTVVPLFVVTLESILTTASLYIQLPQVASPDIAPAVLAAVGVALVLSGVAWIVLPRSVNARSIADAAPTPVEIRPGEKVAWVGHARISTTMLTVLVVILILVLALVIYCVVGLGLWWLLILPVIIGVALLGTASWQVRIDDAGLRARSALGWPQFVVASSDVETATAVTVTPLGEFGGWGVRFAPDGRTGVVTRAGEALEVKRRSGRTLVITVDDAGTAAGLLTTLSARVAKKS